MYQYSSDYLKKGSPHVGRKQHQRLWQGKRMELGFGTRSAIEKIVALESREGKGEHIAATTELLSIGDEELSRRLNEPVEPLKDQLSEA